MYLHLCTYTYVLTLHTDAQRDAKHVGMCVPIHTYTQTRAPTSMMGRESDRERERKRERERESGREIYIYIARGIREEGERTEESGERRGERGERIDDRGKRDTYAGEITMRCVREIPMLLISRSLLVT